MKLFGKKELKDRIAAMCSREIQEIKEHRGKKERLQAALESLNGKIAGLLAKEADFRTEINERIDKDLPVTLAVAKLHGFEIERGELGRRASALSFELQDLAKGERAIEDRLHLALRRALFSILPETEKEIIALIDKATEAAGAWEKDVRSLFSEYGIEMDRKDSHRLLTGFWAIESAMERLSLFCQPQLDGFAHLAFKQYGRQKVA